MEKLLTVLIQTSPLPSHPSTALLEALFRSFDRVEGLKEANIIILADGCECECEKETSYRNDDSIHKHHDNATSDGKKTNFKHGSAPLETRIKYKEHLQLLQEKINNKEPPFKPHKNGSIQLLQLPNRHGSARAIKSAIEIQSVISTPYILIGQHDNFFVRDVSYLRSLLNYMEDNSTKSWLQCVHFPSTATLNYVEKVKRRYDLDISKYCVGSDEGNFIPLVFWYGRTHLARTSYYTKFILKQCPNLQISDHLEELFGTVQLNELQKLKAHRDTADFEDEFRRVHQKYGNYVFFDTCTREDQTEVLYHMSGRKVRAATESSIEEQDNTLQTNADTNQRKNTNFSPHENSFTTARRSIASVPGLEFVPTTKKSGSKKFKQKCFHCGLKGHSFKFCPTLQEEEDSCVPSVDVLQI